MHARYACPFWRNGLAGRRTIEQCLQPTTLAVMHGASFTGDGAAQLRACGSSGTVARRPGDGVAVLSIAPAVVCSNIFDRNSAKAAARVVS